MPKTSQNSPNTSGRYASSSNTQKAQTSITKVIPGQKGTGKNNNKGRGTGNTKVSVSGMNLQGPSENTCSQTKEQRKQSTKKAVTSYQNAVVTAIVSSSSEEE